MTANYTGKLVKVTRIISDPAKHSTGNDGQYFVLDHVGECITCASLANNDSYDAGLTRSFVVGEEGGEYRARVVNESKARIAKSARAIIKQAEESLRELKGQRSWRDEIYNRAIFTGNRILELVEGERDEAADTVKTTESVVVGGVKVTIVIEKA